MKQLTLLVFLGSLLVSTTNAETLVASHYGADSGKEVEILAAYQVSDELWVRSWIKTISAGDVVMPATGYHYATAEADLPSIVSKDMGNIGVKGSDKILYISGNQIRPFNFSKGDGWVDSDAVGWIFIRSYPWVYHWQMGWLYVVEDILVSDKYPNHEVYSWLGGKKTLSFRLYSPVYGWLWTSPYEEMGFVYELGTWLPLKS